MNGWRLVSAAALVLSAASLVVSGLVFRHGNDQDREINGNRVEIARESCRGQNDRHDDTLKKLDEIIAGLPPGREKDRAVANRPGTVLLIDALAPKRDCRALVKQIRKSLD